MLGGSDRTRASSMAGRLSGRPPIQSRRQTRQTCSEQSDIQKVRRTLAQRQRLPAETRQDTGGGFPRVLWCAEEA